jgi:Domain of unknown function (DUF4397)
MPMKIGQFTLRTGMILALWGMLGLGFGLLNTQTAHAADDAFVRVVHAAPFDEHVDVFVDNQTTQPLLTGFTFSNVSDYTPLAAGEHTIKVAPTGQGAEKAQITQSINVQAGAFYTVAIIGDQNTQPGLVVFTDGASVPTDKAVLRVYHLSSDAGALSVSSGGNAVISRLTFKNASDYLTFDTNQSIFQVTMLDKNNQTQTLDAAFEPNRISSVFALGLTAIVDSIGFKFVNKTTAAIPSALPGTGFAPRDDGLPGTIYALIGLAAMALLGGTRLAIAQRRTRQAPVTDTAVSPRLLSVRYTRRFERGDSER